MTDIARFPVVAASRTAGAYRAGPMCSGGHGTKLPISPVLGITGTAAAVQTTVPMYDRNRATGFAVLQASPPREVPR